MRYGQTTGERTAAGLPATEAALWQCWRQQRSFAARQQLIAFHAPSARAIATSHFQKQELDETEYADCLQLAMLGLVESADRFDPDHGVRFMAFAAYRISGAVVDGLKQMTEFQQQSAACKHGQFAIDASPAGRSHAATPTHLLSCVLEGTGMYRAEERFENVPFYRDAEQREVRESLFRLLDSLPAQERKVMQGHYLQQRPFEEIARAMCLTKGRISQIHGRALTRLREHLAAEELAQVTTGAG